MAGRAGAGPYFANARAAVRTGLIDMVRLAERWVVAPTPCSAWLAGDQYVTCLVGRQAFGPCSAPQDTQQARKVIGSTVEGITNRGGGHDLGP